VRMREMNGFPVPPAKQGRVIIIQAAGNACLRTGMSWITKENGCLVQLATRAAKLRKTKAKLSRASRASRSRYVNGLKELKEMGECNDEGMFFWNMVVFLKPNFSCCYMLFSRPYCWYSRTEVT